jgi:hypothetical protein
MMANNPTTRRFLQTQLPVLSKKLLADNPMSPVYKEVHGMMVDIMKPLPPKPSALVEKGLKVVSSVQNTIDEMGKKYAPLVGNNRLTVDEVAKVLPEEIGESLGVKTGGIRTTADLWVARNTIRKAVANPWIKDELLRKTSLKEDDVMRLMAQMKALVMDRMLPEQRVELSALDSQYEKMMKVGSGLLRRLYNPSNKTVHIESLMKSLQNPDSDPSQLFKNFDYFDKNVTKFATMLKGAAANQRRMAILKKAGLATGGVGLALGGLKLAGVDVMKGIRNFTKGNSDNTDLFTGE